MTIVFGGRVLLFAEPTSEDMMLLARMKQAREQWEKDGRPASGQGFW